MKILKRKDIFKKSLFIPIIFSIFPILSFYDFLPLFPLGYAILLLCILMKLLIIDKKFYKLGSNNLLILIFLLINIFNAMIYGFSQSFVNNSAGILVFFLLIFLLTSLKVNFQSVYSLLSLVAIITTAFVFYQFINFYVFDNIVYGTINFLKLNYENYTGNFSITFGRPNGFFMEPAHYSLYVLPIIYLSLVYRKFFRALLIYVGVVLSTSTTGILIGFLIFFAYFIKRKNTRSIIYLLSTTSLFFLALVFFNDYFNENLFSKLSLDYLSNSVRVFKPYTYIKLLDMENFITGIGLNQLGNYIYVNNGLIIDNYSNSYLFIFFSFGLIGLTTWIIFNINLYKIVNRNFVGLFYIFILVQLIDQLIFGIFLIYYITLIYFSNWALEVRKNENMLVYSK